MSTASAGLAEAYMIRKVYKEKMNKMDNVSEKPMNSSHEKAEEKSCRRSASGGGCFSLSMFKKIHPNTIILK
ncbi:hypothetical protein MIMGU_mgv1a017488mg [Erythranthe guttata]|uniref:Uncharacterized protein n=1 Tax=Erythranthe guttata TaxID=4155 RepID=A0A022RST7_ERYGU|nr:hypothetical protein MIMGU_mgv1a017488mg [Erythranthe guttata]